MKPSNELKVLCSIAMIEDLVKEIGGDEIDTISLIQGDLDPHTYELVKGDDEKLSRADLIFYNGMGLEHGASLRHYLETGNNGVALGDAVAAQDPDMPITIDRSIDPHIWMDVGIWARTVPVIVKALSERRPERALLFEKNGDRVRQRLIQVDQEIRELMQKVPVAKRFLVTSHDAFNYFGRAYLAAPGEKEFGQWDRRVNAPEGLAPDSRMSVVDIQNIIDHMEKYHIQVIFSESNVSKDSLRKILDACGEKGLTVVMSKEPLYADAMGPPGSGGDTYIGMVLHNARVISKYLNGDGR
jgi:manganese/zinc/iron transport system substrate-binding protein